MKKKVFVGATFFAVLIFADVVFGQEQFSRAFLENLRARSSSCCKICSVGKACGNTCISKSYKCHVGPGCACNASGGGGNSGGSSGKKSTKKVRCPKIIARIDSETYTTKTNYRCFQKALQAENKGFLEEPLSILRAKGKIRCPQIIADKRTNLYTTKDAYECFSSAVQAESRGYTAE